MKIDRRLMLIGVMLVFLSMVMATQYATTKVGYSYSIVHPSNADIRFIGSDNASDGIRVLRVLDNTTAVKIELQFGNISTNQNKTYTAAFGIVNEEPFAVNITHINVSVGTDPDYAQIWLHGNRSMKADDPTSVFMYNKGTIVNGSDTTAWMLGRGDANPNTMRYNVSNASSEVTTDWDTTADVRYSLNDSDCAYSIGVDGRTSNNASDFVWVQISIDVPGDIGLSSVTGVIWIHFEATTIT